MFAQYAACFGVELTMDQAVALYFRDVFGQSTEASQAIANIFGWLNLFARGMGGLISDWASSRWGMRGRLWAQTLMLLAEGAMVFVFWSTTTLAWALVTLVGLSLFVQLSEGACWRERIARGWYLFGASYPISRYEGPRRLCF
jgi:NNP family nitrate/nitrite transporter-like MFS transporter